MRHHPFLPNVFLLVFGALSLLSSSAYAQTPEVVTTYHSASLYWTPEGGAQGKDVQVEYRRKGQPTWREALPLRHNPIPHTTKERAPYRGSVVMLKPGTRYEFRLSLQGTDEVEVVEGSTWQEDKPVGRTIDVTQTKGTLQITESGTPDAWVVYDGQGATFDADGQEHNIVVSGAYIILRNFKLRHATRDAITLNQGAHDVVIEDNDISKWGSVSPLNPAFGRNTDSGVSTRDESVVRVTIQRNLFHHPNHDTNNWNEEIKKSGGADTTKHPQGPVPIFIRNSEGNNVVRYNAFYSDPDHYFNDIVGGRNNSDYNGSPGADSDIYQNYLSGCWDDAIEADGGGRNVRIWGNFIEDCFIAISTSPTMIGPLYVFRNAAGVGERWAGEPAGGFMKLGHAGRVGPSFTHKTAEELQLGHIYVFHNTIDNTHGQGFVGIGGTNRFVFNTTSRNNILHVPGPTRESISRREDNAHNDFDVDLYNGEVPQGHQARGVQGTPTYEVGAFDRDALVADYRLSASSLGYDGAEVVPNFNDGYEGAAPDIGAHERGAPSMSFGPQAVTIVHEPGEPCTPSPSDPCTDNTDATPDADVSADMDAGSDASVADMSSRDGSNDRPDSTSGPDAGPPQPNPSTPPSSSACDCATSRPSQPSPLSVLLVAVGVCGLLCLRRRASGC